MKDGNSAITLSTVITYQGAPLAAREFPLQAKQLNVVSHIRGQHWRGESWCNETCVGPYVGRFISHILLYS